MIKHKLILLSALLALACSCSDKFQNDSFSDAALKASSVTFSFDSIAEPSNWSRYQTLEEMMAACQIPEAKLKSMSTDELIEVCMSHPLHALYFAYNNELDGAEVVINNFNGFKELKERADAPQKMLAFYEDINFPQKSRSIVSTKRKDFSKMTYMGFVELFLASKELPGLYEPENISAFERISNKVLENKLKQPNPKVYKIRHSLLVNSQIKLKDGTLSNDERDALKSFIKVGGNVENPKEYSRVSAIIAK
ncbi:MAG: hypothetical protein E7104_06690 [Prevotella sp.]|nr:hypothetical protein [Prevotella sp.]